MNIWEGCLEQTNEVFHTQRAQTAQYKHTVRDRDRMNVANDDRPAKLGKSKTKKERSSTAGDTDIGMKIATGADV